MAVYVVHLPIVGLWRPASIMIARRSTRAVYGRETRVLEGNGCRTRRLHTVATRSECALLTKHPLTIARHSGRWQSCSRLMTGGRWAGNSWPLRLHDCLYSRACVVDVHRMCFEWPIDDCSSIIQNTHTGALTAYTHSDIEYTAAGVVSMLSACRIRQPSNVCLSRKVSGVGRRKHNVWAIANVCLCVCLCSLM